MYKVDVTPCRRLPGFIALVERGDNIVQAIFAASWGDAWAAAQEWIADAKAGRVEECN